MVGLVLGLVALAKVRSGQAGGKGMALAGTILSGVSIVIAIIVFVAVGSFLNRHGFRTYTDCLSQAQTAADRQNCADQFTNNFLSPTP